MLKEIPELRAPEKRRTGIEIKPNVRCPDQTEAAMFHSTMRYLLALRANGSLAYNRHFDAETKAGNPN
jgi:hypothetical protein